MQTLADVGTVQGARGGGQACPTFESLVDVTAEVVDPHSVIEAYFPTLGHSVLRYVNRGVVVLLLYPVQDPPEAERCHLQPGGARVWPRGICDGGNSPTRLNMRLGLVLKIPRAKSLCPKDQTGFVLGKTLGFV